MPDWAWVVIGILAGLVLIWLALIVVLWIQQRKLGTSVSLRELLRLVPDVIVLLKRLATDGSVPRGTRWTLGLLLGYLLMPIDLVPDFLPVIGFADDAIVVAIALRLAIRVAGRESVSKHWPGSEAGLTSLLALARIPKQ